MKEVTVLSLSGHVIALEVDAQETIQKYLARSRSKLKDNEVVDEIMEDLELAIASHLSEQGYSEKRAASKQAVAAVLSAMGQVDEEVVEETKTTDWRRLFQEPFRLSKTNKVVFGLAGGVADRVGIDAFWIRFLLVIMVFLSNGWFFWAYLVVGIALLVLEDAHKDKTPPKVREVVQSATSKTMAATTSWGRRMQKLDGVLRGIFRIAFATAAISILLASLVGLSVSLVALFGRPDFDLPLIGTARDALAKIFVISGFGLLIWIAGGVLVASLSSRRKPLTNRGWPVVGAIVPTTLLLAAFITSGVYQRERIVDWAEQHPGNQLIEVEKWENGETHKICVSPFGTCDYPQQSIKRIDTYSPDGTLIESRDPLE